MNWYGVRASIARIKMRNAEPAVIACTTKC
jgi:hypothetical protein